MYIHGDANLLQYILNKILQKQQKSYPAVGMSREAYGESGDRVVAPAAKERCKFVGTISTPSITTTLKHCLLFINFLLLLCKFSWGKYELEW